MSFRLKGSFFRVRSGPYMSPAVMTKKYFTRLLPSAESNLTQIWLKLYFLFSRQKFIRRFLFPSIDKAAFVTFSRKADIPRSNIKKPWLIIRS